MIAIRNLAVCAAVLICMVTTANAADPLSKTELQCAKKMPSSASKLSKAIIKEVSKCRDADISGKEVGSCPNTGNDAKIAKAEGKLASDVAKNCASTCSVSGLPCVSDVSCPPLGLPAEAGRELCSAGIKALPFDIRNLGFPGGLCPTVLGGNITTTDDVSQCVGTIATQVSNAFVGLVYGSITNASGITPEAGKCLSGASKATAKLMQTTIKSVLKCRDAINKGKLVITPDRCTTDDPKASAKIAKALAKVDKLVSAKCTDAQILELDLCGNGVAGTAGVSEAIACLSSIGQELATAPGIAPELRLTGTLSLEEAAFPPTAVCGDGLVNQYQGGFNLIAEECDGASDAACPGQCLPPGDVFECTCANVPRLRYFSDPVLSQLDTGWTGISHDSAVNEGAGFIVGLTNCDCTELTGVECTGSSVDPVCDTDGIQMPRCSWDPAGSQSCDDHGDGDTINTDADCFACDQYSQNAGALCDEDLDCSSLCYDGGGVATGPCDRQSDCAAGEVCRGKCDSEATCLRVILSHPTPISSGGNATCLTTTFREDIFGTSNIITGERDTFQLLRTRVRLGVATAKPCPVCGGVCVGGTQDGEVCEGTCSVSADACRFDSDCPPAETCTTTSPDCPLGSCDLELRCSGGSNDGQACRIGSFTPSFGATSADCPDNGTDISGNGLEIPFFPATSEALSLPATVPCTAAGFGLFDCPCDDDGGLATRPNACLPTCDAGAELGTACATGNTFAGLFTTCAGGPNGGKACDEDTDCAPGTCSNNPSHCIGDPTKDLFSCATNADCGAGTCVDACPSGRCVPLCLPEAEDPEDGYCVGGPTEYTCSGEKEAFRVCSVTEAEGGCSATCSVSATACTADAECPIGESCQGSCLKAQLCEAGEDGMLGTPDDITGAGVCVGAPRECFLDPIVGEGGDIFNGQGDPTNANAVTIYCIPATTSPVINNVAGLGGPGRLHSRGVNVGNGVTSLP